jgi:Flp pilus assembly pilin Flp
VEFFIRDRRGQTFLEYAVIIACVVAALLSMQVYIKRAIQGGLRSAINEVGEQYEPRKTTGDMATTLNSHIISKVETRDAVEAATELGLADPGQYTGCNATVRKEEIVNETTRRRGGETVAELGTSLWD